MSPENYHEFSEVIIQSFPVKVWSSQANKVITMTTQVNPRKDALAGFDDLPDVALVRMSVVAALLSCGPRTVRRRVDAGVIPQPQKQGGVLTWRVGDLRRALRSA